MKMQILSWLCLIMCAQAIAFIACHSDSIKGELSTDMNLKPRTRDDEQHTSTRGVEAVVHEKRGAYGGSDLMKKPAKNKNGASDLPVKTLSGITFCGCMVVINCFFLLV